MTSVQWDAYGLGKDPRCDTCMMHCGYEGSAMQEAMSSPRAFIEMARRSSKPGVAKKARELGQAAQPATDASERRAPSLTGGGRRRR